MKLAIHILTIPKRKTHLYLLCLFVDLVVYFVDGEDIVNTEISIYIFVFIYNLQS